VNDILSSMLPTRSTALQTAHRLATREYVPMAGWLLSWFLLGLAVGHANVVRLIAVNAFVQAIRHLCTVETLAALSRRSHWEKRAYRAARRVALRIDLLSVAAVVIVAAGLVTLLIYRGFDDLATMVTIAALGILSRNPFGLLVARRDRSLSWRLGSTAAFVGASAMVFALGLHWTAAAAALAIRDWGGMIATWLFAPMRQPSSQPFDRPLTFAEVAERTEASARQRLSYRLMSALFGFALGPLGNFAARTGRGVGRLDRRIAGWVPRHRPGFILFTLITGGTAAVFLFVSREPSTVLGAGAFSRLAASGAAVLLWWNYGGRAKDDGEDDED